MAGFLGKSETWPTHSRPLAREALRQAQKAGWLFRPSEGHTFGTLKCGEADGACRAVIYSTSGAADGSTTAKHIKQTMRRCPHGGKDSATTETDEHEQPEPTPSEVEWQVRQLIEAVDGLDLRSLSAERSLAAIEAGDESALDEHERAERRGDNQALTAFDSLRKPVDPWPPEVARAELLDEAEHLLSRGRIDAGDELRSAIEERRR